jgi:aldose 1-epimerase
MMRGRFGYTGDGEPVEQAVLESPDLTMSVLSWGAVIRDLRPRHGAMSGRPLVLGLNSVADYEAHSPHFGAIVGRVANRIANGRARLDGRDVALTHNTADGHHLHGGRRGFGRRNWRMAEADGVSVALELASPDGEEGYPGAVEARVRYRVDGAAVITVICARCDAPTFVNLAQHSYFNLDGAGDVLSHRLRLAAARVTPVDATLIPTGELVAVEGSVFDFRAARPLSPAGASPTVYDINYCLADAPRATPVYAATLEGAAGVRLDLATTEPGLQLYDGNGIDVAVPGLDGRLYGARSGLCLEPQHWPDAPNHTNFPSIVLRPGETYRQRTEFRFSW